MKSDMTSSEPYKSPNALEAERLKRKQADTEQRLSELEEWILDTPCTHPDWERKVSEYNALTTKQELEHRKSNY